MSKLLKNGGTVYARINGNGMAGAGIRSGQVVQVQSNTSWKNGDLVLARVHGMGHTLRMAFRDAAGRVQLYSCHPDHPPHTIEQNEVVVVGVAHRGVVLSAWQRKDIERPRGIRAGRIINTTEI